MGRKEMERKDKGRGKKKEEEKRVEIPHQL